MAFNFINKKILVTGAGRGLGRELSIKLADCGAQVFSVSRTGSTLETLKKERPSITTIKLDLADWENTRRVLGDLEPMDGLINNAAIIQAQLYPAMETSREYLSRFTENNVFSAINCIQMVARKMISAGKSGSIVNVSSIAVLGCHRGNFSYSISKAALGMATKHFAVELGEHNIRVNSVCPTLFLTEGVKELIQSTDGKLLSAFEKNAPMNRIPEVAEVIDPILYLLSEHSAMVSGTDQVIDGAATVPIGPEMN